jgi:FkbM family methyltransferase
MTDDELQSLPAPDLLIAAKHAQEKKDFQRAEAAYLVGIARFPSEFDPYGHPLFQKELLRMLVNNQRWHDASTIAPTEQGVSGAHWHEILYARAYSQAGDNVRAEIWWRRILARQPHNIEARQWLHRANGGPFRTPSSYPPPFCDIIDRVIDAQFKTIFDVGANEGQSCHVYAQSFKDASIFAFEPAPLAFKKLSEAFSENRNIRLQNVALGEVDGQLHMHVQGSSTMNRISEEEAKETIPVAASRLDTFCETLEIKHIDFLKIDTEGHDLSILKGCGEVLQRIDFVQCEVSANDYNRFHHAFADIFDFMTKRGFFLFKIYGQTYEWGNGGYPVLRRFDPVFINLRLVGEIRGVLSGQ